MTDTRIDIEVIKSAVALACRAPSLHNSQPWRWVAEADTVHLYLDKDRVLYATDHSGREALISCGAVLDHFRVAMAAAGWQTHVEKFPNPNNHLHLASVGFSPLEYVTEGHRRRAEAIAKRRTDRLPFGEPPDWDGFEAALRNTVRSDAVRLDTIPEELRADLAKASRLTESLRLYDASYHSELDWWTKGVAISEGIPPDAVPSPAEGDRVEVNRSFPTRRDGDRRAEFGVDQSKILVLSTYDNDSASLLECGEVLSAVLLDATMAGLATCPLSHITELQTSRDIVASLIEQTATPQLLVRVGVAPATEEPPPFTSRRPLDDVLEIR